MGDDRFRHALQHQRLEGLGEDRVTHQAMRLGADQHVAGLRDLLQPSRHVRGYTGDEGVPGRGVPHDHLAGVHAGPRLDANVVDTRQLVVQGRECVGDLARGSHRSQRVVLVDMWDAEDGHHRIPDELLDGAAVPLDHGPHRIEVTAEDL